MTQREKTLAIAVGSLVGVWLAWQGWQRYTGAVDARRSARDAAMLRLVDANNASLKARASLEDLSAWQERSLPADPQVAKSDYRAWLVERLGAAGLDFSDVRLTGARTRGEAYTALSYSTQADGTLAEVTRFLHDFYSTPTLHKATLLKLTPLEGRDQLRMALTVEALIVHGAVRESGLPKGDSGRLARGDAGAYLDHIQGRNLFAEYTPPPPPRPERPRERVVVAPPAPPPFDDAKHAYLTGIVQAGRGLQAWITVRTSGEVLRLGAGDTFSVGQLSGAVTAVTAREVLFEADGATRRLKLGGSLSDAQAD